MYQPTPAILDKYAQLLVNFALGGGQGIKPGETIAVFIPELAKPLYLPLQKTILTAGGHPLMHYLPALDSSEQFYRLAAPDQLKYFPARFMKAKAKLWDHQLNILASHNSFELAKTNPKKIFTSHAVREPFSQWLTQKENQGKFTWTIALYGTKDSANQAGLTLHQYWQQIIKACFLNLTDPIVQWQNLTAEIERIKNKLNQLEISWLHIKGDSINLKIKLGPHRQWLGGGGRNIPSFEIFITPDWRGTVGSIKFNQPLYRYGNLVKEVSLEFNRGVVTQVTAVKGAKFIRQLVKQKNADKIGEFSLTDRRFSHITHFMANTLYDENIGGRYGNTHIALGRGYKDSYLGSQNQITKAKWKQMGFNDSVEHTDLISTEDRTVTATLSDQTQLVIYRAGRFTL